MGRVGDLFLETSKKWMFNWSEFGHAWLKTELNAEITLWDGGQWLGLFWFWLYLVSVYLVFSLDSLHQSMSMNLAGVYYGLATSTTTLAGAATNFTPKLLPGSNARWCVENWPLVSRLWQSFPVTQLCDCHLSVTGTRDRWNNKTVGQFLVLDLWTPEEWKTDKILSTVNIYQ